MKKAFLLLPIIGFLFTFNSLNAQNDFSISFSYFFPKGGTFGNPVAPISFRGIGLEFNDYFSLTTGLTLYHMSGMAIKGLPFEPENPLIKQNFSLMIPLGPEFTIPLGRIELMATGGILGYVNFGTKLDQGNWDRELKDELNMEVVNAEFSAKQKPGWGYYVGGEMTYFVTDSWGIIAGAYYQWAGNKMDIEGDWAGASGSGNLANGGLSYSNATMDFTGWELVLGVVIGGN